jgi:hypothetical protein
VVADLPRRWNIYLYGYCFCLGPWPSRVPTSTARILPYTAPKDERCVEQFSGLPGKAPWLPLVPMRQAARSQSRPRRRREARRSVEPAALRRANRWRTSHQANLQRKHGTRRPERELSRRPHGTTPAKMKRHRFLFHFLFHFLFWRGVPGRGSSCLVLLAEGGVGKGEKGVRQRAEFGRTGFPSISAAASARTPLTSLGTPSEPGRFMRARSFSSAAFASSFLPSLC